ncbi:lipopolysaccharide transport periplasmic protein LptA [Shewanella sedimentimangrovi]|uniref:Lipopolysaccharide export system protein LptA n=1 Tax=Shewanella sedimentimangrovi TaxID=2814293 RepID=A0ABX7QYU5_9GAMM|nr:lipopolysaccharide transport periplasmic protein LptA [Shewanella sedimentimangrovi]QSX36708.1 lipopolysaccharide transport periplasmic protein LptA [Shewanella sedimentimangrovi]
MNPSKTLLALALCLCTTMATAKNNDLLQEVKIAAATQFADIKNKRVVYGGPVLLTQGSLKINAQELSAYTDEATGQRVLVAKGQPATYSQTLDDGREASASANEISYNMDNRTMTLTGNAKIEQEGSQVSADKIVYDIEKQQLKADSSQKGDERVITIIKPENYQEQLEPKPEEQDQNKEPVRQ